MDDPHVRAVRDLAQLTDQIQRSLDSRNAIPLPDEAWYRLLKAAQRVTATALVPHA